MPESFATVLRDQGRGVAGALLVVGLSFLYTMETWWLAWELPMGYLVAYAIAGLGVVLLTTRSIGFRSDEKRRTDRNLFDLLTSFTELLLQSFVTAYLVLLLFGVLELGDSLSTVVRLGLIQVVPLGFGASLANVLLRDSGEDEPELRFPRNLAIFTLGALFVAFPIAPTQEMEKIAGYMTWHRAPLVIVASVAVSYLVLYELGFRGESRRTEQHSKRYQLGTGFVVYAIAAAVSTVLLVAFGHHLGATPTAVVQEVVVLSFLATVGASAGEVVL